MNNWLRNSVGIALSGIVGLAIYKDLLIEKCGISKEGKLSNVACVKSGIEKISQYSQFVNELVLAQAILESNLINKPSKLAINDNNLFGIKCSKKVDKCTEFKTTEYIKGKKLLVNASFAHFESISEGIKFRLEMFKMPRYQNVTKCSSFSDCAVRIQKSGYATDPRYANELIRVYKEFIE